MEFEFGKHAIKDSASYLNSKFENINYKFLRKYFEINNIYVLEKMLLIVFPFLKQESIETPDLYRPDLYIPIMSFITLVLLNGVILGFQNKFHPELLYMSFTRIICVHLILNLLYKFVGYFFDISLKYFDLIAFTGYKFFVINLIKILKFNRITKIFSFYFYISFFFFLSRSLKTVFLKTNDSRKNIYSLFLVVAIEILAILYQSSGN